MEFNLLSYRKKNCADLLPTTKAPLSSIWVFFLKKSKGLVKQVTGYEY